MGLENKSLFANKGVDFSNTSNPIDGIRSAILRIQFEISEEVKDYLDSKKISATKALSNSVGVDPSKSRITRDGAEIVIQADDYFKFIDEGVDGVEEKHGSPYSFKSLKPFNKEGIQSIKTWIGARQLEQFAPINQMAYAISVNIKKKGIKPKEITKDLFEGEENLKDKIANALELSLGTAVEVTLINTLRP